MQQVNRPASPISALKPLTVAESRELDDLLQAGLQDQSAQTIMELFRAFLEQTGIWDNAITLSWEQMMAVFRRELLRTGDMQTAYQNTLLISQALISAPLSAGDKTFDLAKQYDNNIWVRLPNGVISKTRIRIGGSLENVEN